jgi:hypothetical protein
MYNVALKRVRGAIVLMEKQQMLRTLECVTVTSVTQHAKRMRRIILSSASCLVLTHFSTLSPKLHDSRGGGEH